MVRLQDRVLVYHCRTLIRNSTGQWGHHNRSPLVDRLSFGAPARTYARAGSVKDVPEHCVKDCHGTGHALGCPPGRSPVISYAKDPIEMAHCFWVAQRFQALRLRLV